LQKDNGIYGNVRACKSVRAKLMPILYITFI
jgi:hypothetical protein